MLAKETNIELLKKIKTKKKTTIPFLRIQDWKKFKVETGKINKILPNIPTGNITELYVLIYPGVKLVSETHKEIENLDWRTGKIIATTSERAKKGKKDLRRLTVTHTPVKDHQQALVWKTRKGNIIT